MESGTISGLESGLVFGVAASALLFGIVYDRLVAYLEDSGRAQGYMALLVVGGVSISLALSALLIGWQAALVVLFIFGLTGIPMVVGSIWRHTDARARQGEEVRQVLEEMRQDSSLAREILDEIQAMRRREAGSDDNA